MSELPSFVSPHVPPNTRVTLGRVGSGLSSRSHPVIGAETVIPGGTPTHWTPWTFAVPIERAHRSVLGRPGMVERSPGAWFTPPNLFQLVGIPETFLRLVTKPAAGRTGTPPVRHVSMMEFPDVRPPTPTNPLPSAWTGSLYYGQVA